MSKSILALTISVFAFVGCSESSKTTQPENSAPKSESQTEDYRTVIEREAANTKNGSSKPETLTVVDKQVACKKAIAELMGQPSSIMKATALNGQVTVKYNRPDDGKLWTNECKFEGDKIIYRSVDLDGPSSGPGRWRDTANDEKITWMKSGNEIEVTVSY